MPGVHPPVCRILSSPWPLYWLLHSPLFFEDMSSFTIVFSTSSPIFILDLIMTLVYLFNKYFSGFCFWEWVQLLAALKPMKSSGWCKGNFAVFQRLATLGEGRVLSTGQLPHHWQWARAFIGGGRSYMQKQHSQLWQSSWNWSCSGLSSVIVLSTVNLQFQGRFVPIS